MPSAHDILFPHDDDVMARYRREHDEQQEAIARKRRDEERAQQRTQVVPAPDDYWAQVDARIEEKFNVILDAVGQALDQLLDKQHENIQAALDRRDDAIQALRNEVEIKIGLGRKLARLKAEIAEARQEAPSFKCELDGLREQVAKQQKIISRLRGQQSELMYAQQQNSKEITLTGFRLTTEIGAQTRAVLEQLRASGFDLVEEMQPLSGLAS